MGRTNGRVAGMTKVVNSGPPSSRFNLVLVSEGYTSSQLPNFISDASGFINTLFNTRPFDELRPAINVFRIDVVSDESGIDDPTQCGDKSVGSGRQAATFFDGKSCGWGLRRLLEVDEGLAIDIVRQFVPQWHSILVIVNSTIWAGAGGAVARMTTGGPWQNTAIHELGHSFFGLADEYEYYVGCGLDADRDEYGSLRFEPGEPNITKERNRGALKWRDLVTPGTAVPTLRNADCRVCDPQASPVSPGTVGSFEGAGYYHCHLFRPEFDCMMRTPGKPPCAVCRRRITQRLTPFMPVTPPGPATPPVPLSKWCDLQSGTLRTSDQDDIDYLIERGVVDPGVVEFVLSLGPGVTWKKELNVPDGEGNSWDIVADGAGASAANGLWAGQVQNGQSLTFRKAKALGNMWDVHTLSDLSCLTPGSRVTFTWATD